MRQVVGGAGAGAAPLQVFAPALHGIAALRVVCAGDASAPPRAFSVADLDATCVRARACWCVDSLVWRRVAFLVLVRRADVACARGRGGE